MLGWEEGDGVDLVIDSEIDFCFLGVPSKYIHCVLGTWNGQGGRFEGYETARGGRFEGYETARAAVSNIDETARVAVSPFQATARVAVSSLAMVAPSIHCCLTPG